jgi:hypothetical protein
VAQPGIFGDDFRVLRPRSTWPPLDVASGVTRVVMTSPPDPRTGLRMTRRFDIPDRGSTVLEIQWEACTA